MKRIRAGLRDHAGIPFACVFTLYGAAAGGARGAAMMGVFVWSIVLWSAWEIGKAALAAKEGE